MRCSALSLLLAALPAAAHNLPHPKRDLLVVAADRATVFVSLELNPGDDSAEARALFDRDSDGRLSPAEQEMLVGFLARVAEQGVALSEGERPVALSRAAVRGIGLDREVADSAIVGVEVELRSPLAPLGAFRDLRFQDQTRGGKSHVLVEVRVAEGLTLARPNQGELSPDGRALQNAMVSREAHLEVRVRGPVQGRWDGFLRWLGVR